LRPKPFVPELVREAGDNNLYVKDKTSGIVWHRCEFRTLYIDTDRSGTIYHSNYLRYFEFGRASLMRDAAFPYSEIEKSGYVYPIIEINATYHHPLYYDDPIYIHTRPSQLEKVRVRFDYLITHKQTGNIICNGFSRHCATNSAGAPVAIDTKTVHLWKTFPK
jgi:acyl-CoA thioester hydrolase